MGSDLERILISEAEIKAKLAELARKIEADYAGQEVLLVGVLDGALVVMADLIRELHIDTEMDWMAISSYGAGTKSSGVVRIMKDLGADIQDRHVLVVEDIIDSGLTLSWLLSNLRSRGPRSVEVVHAAAQAGRRQGRDQREVRRIRRPERVRGRLRAGLRPAFPGSSLRRHARAARLQFVGRPPHCGVPAEQRRPPVRWSPRWEHLVFGAMVARERNDRVRSLQHWRIPSHTRDI